MKFLSDAEMRELARKEHEEILREFDDDRVPFGSDKRFDDGRGNNFDVSWRDMVLNHEVPRSDVGFNRHGLWAMVGYGDKPTNDNCNKFKKFTGCADLERHNHFGLDGKNYAGKVYVKRVWFSCRRSSCPVCYATGYAVRAAQRAEVRLREASRKFGVIEHAIHSPPVSDYGLSFRELCRKAVKLLKARGVIGGCMIYHHFRYRNRREAFLSGKPIGWYFSPHFHVVGFIKPSYGRCRRCKKAEKAGRFGKGVCDGCSGFEGVVRRDFEKHGWITKVKGERKTVGGTLWYQLNHASVVRGVRNFRIVRWFGVCSYRKMKVDKELFESKPCTCPICGGLLYHLRYHGNCAKFLASVDNIQKSKGIITNGYSSNGELLWSAYGDG